jgi:hypothetical protein
MWPPLRSPCWSPPSISPIRAVWTSKVGGPPLATASCSWPCLGWRLSQPQGLRSSSSGPTPLADALHCLPCRRFHQRGRRSDLCRAKVGRSTFLPATLVGLRRAENPRGAVVRHVLAPLRPVCPEPLRPTPSSSCQHNRGGCVRLRCLQMVPPTSRLGTFKPISRRAEATHDGKCLLRTFRA